MTSVAGAGRCGGDGGRGEGPGDGVLKLFTENVRETALNEEMTEHLGHEKIGKARFRDIFPRCGNGSTDPSMRCT